jgi:hypothetical protein
MIQPATDPHDVERYATPRSIADHLRHVRDRLHRQFDDTAGPDVVDEAVDEAARRLDHAQVETFVPVLVERTARAQLAARHRRAGPGGDATGRR